MSKNLSEKLEQLLAGVYKETPHKVAEELIYQKCFEDEGIRKADFITTRISRLSQPELDSLKSFVAVSVGGADGSDLLSLIKNTPISEALLVEYDNSATNVASSQTAKLICEAGGSLEVITGDANQQLSRVINILKAKRESGMKGIVLMFHGILHELPSRSPEFELIHYLSQLTSVFDQTLLFISEPVCPENESDNITFRIKDICETRLLKLVDHINAALFKSHYKSVSLNNGLVRTSFRLSMETLHKLIRNDKLARFQHEMGEILTQFKATEIESAINKALPLAEIEVTSLTTRGFRNDYNEARVEMNKDGAPLPCPKSHVQITAIKLLDPPKSPESTTAGQTQNVDSVNDEGPPSIPPQVVDPPATRVHIPSFDHDTADESQVDPVLNSTIFFDSLFRGVFPGLRGIEWFIDRNVIVSRLGAMLNSLNSLPRDQLVWWWAANGDSPIDGFEKFGFESLVMDSIEIKPTRMAVINLGTYYQKIIYVETEALPPCGLYPTDGVQDFIDRYGYYIEEFAIFKEKLVSRSEYDDGATIIDGNPVKMNGDAELRVRYLTPWNFFIAPHGSPINTQSFDSRRKYFLNGILEGSVSIEEFVSEFARLPKRPW